MAPMTDAVRLPVQKIAHPDVEALDLATIMRTVGDPVRLAIVREPVSYTHLTLPTIYSV